MVLRGQGGRRSARPGVTFFHDDVSLDNLVPVDPFESAKEIGTFPGLGLLGRWRGGKQGDDDAAFADANGFTLFHPIENTSKVMPQLPNGSRLHVEQRCYTCHGTSTPNPCPITLCHYFCDLTVPEVQDYMRKVAGTLSKEWGYPLLKMDGLYRGLGIDNANANAAISDLSDVAHQDPEKTNVEVGRDGLKRVREAVGPDTFLLGWNRQRPPGTR